MSVSDSAPVVYVDGACPANGQEGARGGLGLYWGKDHKNNFSGQIPDSDREKPTNNRAELWAAIAALQQAQRDGLQELVIISDSQYVIHGITDYIEKWKAQGKLSKHPNSDLWDTLDKLTANILIQWEHTPGHSGVFGNTEADKLATDGVKSDCVWQEILITKNPSEPSISLTEPGPGNSHVDSASTTHEASNNSSMQAEAINNATVDNNNLNTASSCMQCNRSDETESLMQCFSCKTWLHYSCTRLPRYMIYAMTKPARRYVCKECTNTPNTFMPSYNPLNSVFTKHCLQVSSNAEASSNTDFQLKPGTAEVGSNTDNHDDQTTITSTGSDNVDNQLRQGTLEGLSSVCSNKAIETVTESLTTVCTKLHELCDFRSVVREIESDLVNKLMEEKELSAKLQVDLLQSKLSSTNKECDSLRSALKDKTTTVKELSHS